MTSTRPPGQPTRRASLPRLLREALADRRAELELDADALLPLEKYDDEEGFSYWDHQDPETLRTDLDGPPVEGYTRLSCTQCTNSARLLAHRHKGKVVGYVVHDPTKDARIGAYSLGHDFAIIDNRWLVDYWAKHVDGSREAAVLDLEQDREEILKLYGDPGDWELTADYTRQT